MEPEAEEDSDPPPSSPVGRFDDPVRSSTRVHPIPAHLPRPRTPSPFLTPFPSSPFLPTKTFALFIAALLAIATASIVAPVLPEGMAENDALAAISGATLFSRAGADAFLDSLEAYNAEHALHATAGHQPALSAWGWVACGQDDSMTMSSDLSGVDRSAVSLYIPALYFPVAHNMSVYATRDARRVPVLHGCSPRVFPFHSYGGHAR